MILGIDAGRSGGLVVLDEKCKPVAYAKMPAKKNKVDAIGIQSFVASNEITFAYVEKQQVRGRQAGGLTNGTNYGRILAVLELAGIPYEEIEPKIWQQLVHGRPTSDKWRTVQWCEYMGYPVPMTSTQKNATPHDGVADAWAIAWAGVAINN